MADTLLPRTQTFGVHAQIVAGCGVVGGGTGTGLDFGTLDFGTHPAISTGQVSSVTSGSALQIECASGTTLTMTIDGGLAASSGNTQRNLQGTGGARIAYQLYADAGHSQVIAIGRSVSIAVSGIANLPIYGSLILPGGSVAAGTYTDTVQVTLSY
nr:spore coat U domain-containing protein [Burkholderia anthina]